MKKIIVYLFITIILFACVEKEITIPENVLGQNEMTAILSDVHIAQSAIGNAMSTDSSRYSIADYLDFILKNHQTSKKQFVTSLEFYSNHPEMLQEVYDSVLTGLSKIEAGLEK